MTVCLWCKEAICGVDSKVADKIAVRKADGSVVKAMMHYECKFRSAQGSVGHIQRKCCCYGGTEEDPEGMSMRDAAKAAVEAFLEIKRRRSSLNQSA